MGGGPPWGRGGRGGWFMQAPMWGFLQPCLLLLLAESPKHGYSLMDELSRRNLLGGDVDVGNLYRTLRRMEMAGMVESAWSEAGDGPHKRTYSITPRGTEMVRNFAGVLEERTASLNRFLDEFHKTFGADGALHGEFVVDNEEDLR